MENVIKLKIFNSLVSKYRPSKLNVIQNSVDFTVKISFTAVSPITSIKVSKMLTLDALSLLLSASLVLPTQFFTTLTIPYFAAIHQNDFDTSLWGNWFRLASYVLSLLCSLVALAGSLLSIRSFLYGALPGFGLSLAMTVFNVLFGLRVPALVLCEGDIGEVCMEDTALCRAPDQVKAWEAFFFSFSLCALLCVQAAAIGAISNKLTKSPVPHISPTQAHTEVSARALEVSTILVETQKAPKSGLEEKALVESHFTRKPEPPVQGKTVRFGVEEKGADLLSFKDFETSSAQTKPDLSIGRRRGRGKK